MNTVVGSENVNGSRSPPMNTSLAEILDRHTCVGTLWRTEGDHIRCVACGHRCLIASGRRGVCRVRINDASQLRVPFGYVAGGLASDPVEKKPFFHVYPGSDALTFGMLGCDFHCAYCQNWMISQALRDNLTDSPILEVTAEQVVQAAQCSGARLVVSSYNEPLISAEWAAAVFQPATELGLACACVSNGNATPEVLDFLLPWIVAYKVDLKGFNEQRYRTLGGTLKNVTESIRMVYQRGLWLEIVTLLVPGFNDSEGELRDIARFIASVSRSIPWHVTAFHPDYKMADTAATAAEQLVRAAEIGAEEGLHFVYAGNLPGHVGGWENTICPVCGELLITRVGYTVSDYRITAEGKCPSCRTSIPGIWSAEEEMQMNLCGPIPRNFHRGPRPVRLK